MDDHVYLYFNWFLIQSTQKKIYITFLKVLNKTHLQYSTHTFDGSFEFVIEIESAGVLRLSNVLVIKCVNWQNLLAEQQH